MKLMNNKFNFMVFLVLLLVFGQLMNLAVAEGQKNITDEEIGKQILANAPLGIQSGSDLERARYAYSIYCDILTNENTTEEKDLAGTLQSADHADSLKTVFHEMGISSKNTLEIAAGKINQTEEKAINRTDDAILLATSNRSSSAHAAVGLAFVDRIYVFDPLMTAVEIDQHNGSESRRGNGMDIRDWGDQMKTQGYSVFRGEGDSWHFSVEKVEDKVFKRSSCAGEYQAELIPQCKRISQSENCSGQSSILRFMVLPDNKVIGIIEGSEETGDQYTDALSQDRRKGAIYGYYDSRIKRLSFISIMQPQKTEGKPHPLFATYEDIKNGQMQIVDARTPQEFAAGAIPGAVNLPYDMVQNGDNIIDDTSLNATFADLDKNRPVVVYTSTGVKASPVCFALQVLGYDARLYTYQDWLEHVAGTSG